MASQTAQATPSIPPITVQVISPNAYKVPYLGYDGIFYLNAESQQSTNDPRNPKRIEITKMDQFSFYKDAAGKSPIARNCAYIYMGAVPDPKYYAEYKSSWDVFELEKDEKQDPGCKQFQYLSFTAPHGDPIHMHFRYGDQKSDLSTIVGMSTTPENKAKFNPWWSTYCGGGKTTCGKDE